MKSIHFTFRSCFTIPNRDKRTKADQKPTQAFYRAAVSPPLERLPLELLHAITSYLPPSSELALRHTNRWFNAYAGPATSLVVSNRVCNSPDCRLAYLCFLERDAKSPRHQFTCSVCVQRHLADRFSKIELQESPESRTCRRAWICEHRTLSLAEYRDILAAPFNANGAIRYPHFLNSDRERHTHWSQCCTKVRTARCFACLYPHDDRIRTLATRWSISLRDIMAYGDALARGIENEPAKLDFHICPHLKPKDRMADLLACNIESQITKKPIRRLECRDCQARFWCCFQGGYFQISCHRVLGYGSADDPAWSSQLHLPCTIELTVRLSE